MAADGLHATALAEQCSRLFPCLADRVRRSKWGLKVALVLLHVIFVGVLFLLDADLIRKTKEEPWYTAIYLGFLVATLVQYFFTSGSSPGYVVDAMRVGNEMCTTSVNSPMLLNQSISRNNSFTSSMNRNQLGRRNYGMNSSSWLKLVMDLYPPGSSIRNWTCTYCNIIQPPRSKHCHDCDKCVLQFDHHCVWLGTCIGQGNHCRFWWYIFEESILCTWTVVLYIDLLSSKIIKDWWKELFVIVLLAALIFCLVFLLLLLLFHSYLVLTNQTTYELVRRRRILYLRGIPERVHPFSRGICKNLYVFCCSRDGKYSMEAVPTMEELEAKARPYTCMDIMSCRCC
ncbi:protein S-acyltransferase 10 isoform X1 [Elaeis guineensis]|uniref:S-acyltransferase n=1 Tax=Elaeis guineensis var. tenera TaxID=51953 RepID=A0A6I9R033_ELAGV|nr:protein S-acyltransferase 10 isoform X1 [Elaeis guineensis]